MLISKELKNTYEELVNMNEKAIVKFNDDILLLDVNEYTDGYTSITANKNNQDYDIEELLARGYSKAEINQMLELQNKQRAFKQLRQSKTKFKNYNIKREATFLVYDKNGLLIPETVKLIGELVNSEGEKDGYVLVLDTVKEVNKNLNMLSSETIDGICVYIKNEDKFICNDLDDDIIKDSCADIRDIKLIDLNNYYRLKIDNKTYRFSNDIIQESNSGKVYSNIGKFIEA